MPNYTKKIVYLSEAQYQELIANQTITVDGTTVTYDENTIYMTPQNTPLYAQDLGAWAKASTKPTYTATEVGAISTSAKGANNGVAELDANGKVPSSQLPSYVDDVLEYNSSSNFPATGETGKIYIDLSDNTTYRWSGSTYVAIGSSLALGTTSSTAFRGDYGNAAYQHASAKGSEFSSGLYKITTNAEGHVTAATAVAKEDITALGIPGTTKRGNATIFVGRCDSGADTSTKVVDCPDYDQLVNGDIIYVHFSYTNNVQPYSLKLNVNSTGAKDIKTYSSTNAYVNLNSAKDIRKGVPVKFLYMGGYWVMDAASKIKVRDIENEVASKTLLVADQSNATDADASVGMAHYVSYSSGKLYVRGSEVITADKQKRGNAAVFVGTCNTSASTAEKAVTCSDYDSLVVGDKIYVTFTQRNSVSGNNITLNVNNKGAKQIRTKIWNNDFAVLREPSALGADGEYLFTYDGTYWVLTASSIAYTHNISQYDIKQRPLIIGDYRHGDVGYCTQSLGETYDAYYYYGKLYVKGKELLTEESDAFKTRLGKIDAVDVRHDQYLYDLESNEYRVVLRMFFVTPDGHILKKDQSDVDSDFLGNKNYRVSVEAYDSSNNVVTTYHDVLELHWCPSYDGVYQEWSDESDIFSAPYWLEVTTRFVLSSDIDHIAVSFTNLDQDLYMYNPNQDLTFNITSLSHNLVEIKNVGLVYANGLDAYNGGYLGTGYNLPDETVYVPQIWASDLESAELIRGYSYAIKNYDADNDEAMYWASANSYDYDISNKVVVHDGKFFYTTGYFEIPLGGSEDYIESNQGVANAGKVLAVNSSGVVEPVSMNAVQSNQGIANAGKFLVVNSSGTVEPVSMTAWQGGSY